MLSLRANILHKVKDATLAETVEAPPSIFHILVSVSLIRHVAIYVLQLGSIVMLSLY